jgi:hypothetical protein
MDGSTSGENCLSPSAGSVDAPAETGSSCSAQHMGGSTDVVRSFLVLRGVSVRSSNALVSFFPDDDAPLGFLPSPPCHALCSAAFSTGTGVEIWEGERVDVGRRCTKRGVLRVEEQLSS